jgi:branched-chain amino acid transport system substrate-binding protein
MGPASAGRVFQVGYGHYNMGGEIERLSKAFKAKFNEDMYTQDVYTIFAMLSEAMARAKSTDPVKVAAMMEGMKMKSFNGEIEMRKADHQLQQGLYIARWEKAGGKNVQDAENTGYTFAPVKYYEPYVASTPTSCVMKRP